MNISNSDHFSMEKSKDKSEFFWIKDFPSNRILYVSSAFERVWKRQIKTLLENQYSWLDIVHPEDRKIAIQVFQLSPDDPEWIDPFRIVFPDGTTKWIRCRAFKIIGEDGNINKIIGFAKDVTGKECEKIENQSLFSQRTESFGSELCSAI